MTRANTGLKKIQKGEGSQEVDEMRRQNTETYIPESTRNMQSYVPNCKRKPEIALDS